MVQGMFTDAFAYLDEKKAKNYRLWYLWCIDGPTDLVILEVDKNKFLVRAKQVEDRVYIWVAFHGAPQDGCKYMATIKFDFPDDDDDCRKIQENGGDVS